MNIFVDYFTGVIQKKDMMKELRDNFNFKFDDYINKTSSKYQKTNLIQMFVDSFGKLNLMSFNIKLDDIIFLQKILNKLGFLYDIMNIMSNFGGSIKILDENNDIIRARDLDLSFRLCVETNKQLDELNGGLKNDFIMILQKYVRDYYNEMRQFSYGLRNGDYERLITSFKSYPTIVCDMVIFNYVLSKISYSFPLYVYRGLSEIKENDLEWQTIKSSYTKEGEVNKLTSFTSTSLNLNTAKSFGYKYEGYDGVYSFYIPPKTPCFYNVQSCNRLTSEYEVILPIGSEFKVENGIIVLLENNCFNFGNLSIQKAMELKEKIDKEKDIVKKTYLFQESLRLMISKIKKRKRGIQ